MKFYSLRDADRAILLEKIGCKFSKDHKRTASLELSVRIKGTMFSDLPHAFRRTLELMREDSNVELVELESTFDGLKMTIFHAPDVSRATMAVMSVSVSEFNLHRVKDAKNIIRLGFKATFDYTEDHEAAVWMVTNLGNSFFWELEDMQPALLVEEKPSEAEEANGKKPAKKGLREPKAATERVQ